jgi:hypothetical protein
MLLLSEVSLTTHHITLAIAFGVIISRAIGQGDPVARRWLWAVAAALVLCGLASSDAIKMLSPFLAATILLLVAAIAIALNDRSGALAGSGAAVSPSAGKCG